MTVAGSWPGSAAVPACSGAGRAALLELAVGCQRQFPRSTITAGGTM